MTHPDFNTKILTQLLGTGGGTFAVIIFLVAFQYIFKLDFECPCDPDENIMFCSLYITLPFGIFFLIMVVADTIFLKVCTSCDRSACCRRVVRAVIVGLLWIVTALLDGDWYVCIATTSYNITVKFEQLACKKEPTSSESTTIKDNRNTSRVIGLSILFGVLLLWTVSVLIIKRWRRKIYSKAVYEECILDETENILTKDMTGLVEEPARLKATEQIDEIKKDLNLYHQQLTSNKQKILVTHKQKTTRNKQKFLVIHKQKTTRNKKKFLVTHKRKTISNKQKILVSHKRKTTSNSL